MNIESFHYKNDVEFISITNNVGLEVVLSNYGASIYQLKIDLEEMVLTPKNYETFFHNTKYYGLTIGRIAGRVKNGLLTVNDKTYQLEQNEGSNCLHGGYHSIAFRNWKTEVIREKECIIIRFSLTTKEGEGGFNGKCEYIVSYKIYENDNIVEVKYDAVCNEDTYFSLTNHSYFNLGHDKDILSHRLRIKANEVSTMDKDDFCINGYIPVDNTIFDFRELKLIKKDIEDKELHNTKWLNGYDHRYHLEKISKEEPNITLNNGKYQMDIYTDFDAVHIYTGGFTSHDVLVTGDNDDVYKGVTLECTSLYPEFKNKNEHYVHFVKYVFRRKSDE